MKISSDNAVCFCCYCCSLFLLYSIRFYYIDDTYIHCSTNVNLHKFIYSIFVLMYVCLHVCCLLFTCTYYFMCERPVFYFALYFILYLLVDVAVAASCEQWRDGECSIFFYVYIWTKDTKMSDRWWWFGVRTNKGFVFRLFRQ